MEKRKRIRFTNHAIERAKECQIPLKKAVWLFANATEEKLLKGMRQDKKYTVGKNISHWRNGTLIFVAADIIDKHSQEPMRLILTVTDQRIYLPAEAL